jgi:hypothetical protein
MVLLDQKKKLFEEQKIQIDKAIEDKNNRLKSLDQIRVSQQNAYTQQLTQKRGTSGLSKNMSSIDKSSEGLNNDISALTQKSFALADSIAKIDQTKLSVTNESFSSELGPLLYLSRITGIPMDNVVNWFILILVIVFDPLAVSLVIAANHLSSKEKQKETLDELSELGQEIGIGYEEPTQSFPTPVNDQITDAVTQVQKNVESQITDSVTQGVVEVTKEEKEDFFSKKVSLEEENIEMDSVTILPQKESSVEDDMITPKDFSEDLIISEEISILNNEDEQNEFYEETPKKKKPQPAVIEHPTYTRGISV